MGMDLKITVIKTTDMGSDGFSHVQVAQFFGHRNSPLFRILLDSPVQNVPDSFINYHGLTREHLSRPERDSIFYRVLSAGVFLMAFKLYSALNERWAEDYRAFSKCVEILTESSNEDERIDVLLTFDH